MVESKILVKSFLKEEDVNKKQYEENFDWELFLKCNRPGLNENKSIKTKRHERVYSYEKYAQVAYHMYSKNLEDKSMIAPKKGDIVEGVVVGMDNNCAYVDINYREYAYIELRKENKNYLNDIKVGNKLSVQIINEKNDNNALIASYTNVIKALKEEELKKSIDKPIAYKAKIKELINGGYIVDIDGVKCFMPGSQVTMNKITNFSDYVGKDITVMAVNFSPEKGTVVVSSRAYLKTLIPAAIENLKNNIKEKYTGIVTGTTNFGVFCEFNTCLTGLIHISDLDEVWLEKHKLNKIKPNDKIDFYIKEIVQDDKIILTQVLRDDPWDNIEEKYKVQSIVKGKVINIKEYGAFIELEKGISGLLHFSEYKGIELKEGDLIDVKIDKIEKSLKKIIFSILK